MDMYPRSLYHMVIVQDAEQEREARAEGYFALDEPVNRFMDEQLAEPVKRRGRPPKAKAEQT